MLANVLLRSLRCFNFPVACVCVLTSFHPQTLFGHPRRFRLLRNDHGRHCKGGHQKNGFRRSRHFRMFAHTLVSFSCGFYVFEKAFEIMTKKDSCFELFDAKILPATRKACLFSLLAFSKCLFILTSTNLRSYNCRL